MSKPEIIKLTASKDIPIGDEIILKGSVVDAIVTLGCYKIFHHSGWWLCGADWFEEAKP